MDPSALRCDFVRVAEIAGHPISEDAIAIDTLRAPHMPPPRLQAGKMAVYVFAFGQTVLKVGKVGQKSSARFTSQHYRAGSAPSTLAASVRRHSVAIGALDLVEGQEGEWIKKNTDRTNFVLDATHGPALLTLLEAFLQCRLKPQFEGFASQRDA